MDRRVVLDPGDIAHRDVLLEHEVVAHEVLEDDPDVPPEAVDVVLPEIHAVEQDPPLVRVVEPSQQLDQRGLAGAVLAHQRDPLARRQREVRDSAPPSSPPGILESHPLEHEALPDRHRHLLRPRIAPDAGLDARGS